MRYEIRAMSIGEIVDTSFRVLRNHFVPLVGVSAIVNVPVSLGQALIQVESEAGAAASVPMLGFGIGFLSFALFSPIVSAAVIAMIGELYLAREARIGEAFRVAFGMLLPLIGTSLLAGLLMVAATLALIVPGIWFALGTIVLTPVMVVERMFGMKAIRRSLDLLKGNRGRAFLLYLLVGILASVLGGAFGLVAGAAPILGGLASGIVSAVTGAFLAVLAVVLYFEIRCRKEAFEIEHLARLVQGAGAPAAVVGS